MTENTNDKPKRTPAGAAVAGYNGRPLEDWQQLAADAQKMTTARDEARRIAKEKQDQIDHAAIAALTTGFSQSQVAQAFGVSRSYVSQRWSTPKED